MQKILNGDTFCRNLNFSTMSELAVGGFFKAQQNPFNLIVIKPTTEKPLKAHMKNINCTYFLHSR